MEGFGSADVTTPFNYGSVEDSMSRGETLEHKLRKKYWKTKQTVLQKLGKNQDEFVVAGDSGIDTQLENAYHLKSSCHDLLLVLDRYSTKLRAATTQEEVMGEYLRVWSETEYTNAGEVMQTVGKLQLDDSKARLNMLPSLLRMQSEFLVFQDSAIRDLHHSIQLLEKCRTEYRAALLWMKDVSEKLRNPDYRDQLVRFREAQAAVKETKGRFEKLKHDLSEKIDMVSASRCNLLSRSLPIYQNEVLKFSDCMANEFHKILVDLRSHHHHQYKIRRLFEEIRDLESDETAVAEERCFLELMSPTSPTDSNPKASQPSEDDDDPLLDIGQNSPSQTEQSTEGEMLNTLDNLEQEAKINDLVLGGTNVGLESMQKESVSPTTSEEQQSQQPQSELSTTGAAKETMGDLGDLLQIDSDAKANGNEDILSNEWSKFSAFMPETKTDPQSPTAGWEKDFLTASSGSLDPLSASSQVPHSTPPDGSSNTDGATDLMSMLAPSEKKSDKDIDELLGMTDKKEDNAKTSALDENSLLSDDLRSFGITPTEATQSNTTPATLQTNELDLDSLDAAYFQQYALTQSQQQSMSSTQQQQPHTLAGAAPTFRSPLPTSIGPIIPRQLPPSGGFKMPPGREFASKKPFNREKQAESKDKKGTSWMNVFQHLDPLVNEKA